MGDGAEIGIARNAGGEDFLAFGVPVDLAKQFDLDQEGIVDAFGPSATLRARRRDFLRRKWR
jgi:hypothetical protein